MHPVLQDISWKHVYEDLSITPTKNGKEVVEGKRDDFG
jgi:hypothetical protein